MILSQMSIHLGICVSIHLHFIKHYTLRPIVMTSSHYCVIFKIVKVYTFCLIVTLFRYG